MNLKYQYIRIDFNYRLYEHKLIVNSNSNNIHIVILDFRTVKFRYSISINIEQIVIKFVSRISNLYTTKTIEGKKSFGFNNCYTILTNQKYVF